MQEQWVCVVQRNDRYLILDRLGYFCRDEIAGEVLQRSVLHVELVELGSLVVNFGEAGCRPAIRFHFHSLQGRASLTPIPELVDENWMSLKNSFA